MAPKPKAKPASVVAEAAAGAGVLLSLAECRLMVKAWVARKAECQGPGEGPPQPRPVNPGDIGPMEFAFGDRVVASHLAPFPAPAGPSREEFLVARAVKEDLGLRDETPIMVRFDPDSGSCYGC